MISQPPKTPLYLYMQMALGLVYELGLNEPPQADSSRQFRSAMCNTLGHLPVLNIPAPPPERTMNERRAVLSCYVLSTL